ncbi:MAG TPA: protein kinase [Gaiellales bacterium]|nr:protein kinase [Gaiellales bacterium]
MSASNDARIGSRVADYRIETALGRGGMSVVYLAEDLRLRRWVALKILAPELASDAHFREQFLRESKLAASIDHPNIIPIYEAGEGDGCLFIAMRYVEGTDLKALLREQGVLEPGRSLAVAAQVAEALDTAHEHGLVHRDVKPSNVLLDRRGHCYLSDFGLTKSASDRSGIAKTSQIIGTVDYAAPEQIRSDFVDGRTDVYSLGCLLFECLTGEVPFPHESEAAVIYAQLEEPPPLSSDRRAGLPTALDAPLARAIAKLPEERYPTCGALVEAIQDGLGLLVVPTSTAQRRQFRHLLVLATAGALAAAAVGGWLISRPGGRSAIPPGSDALVRINPKTNAISRTTPVGRDARAIAVGGGAAWVANYKDDAVSRVDASTNAVRTIPVKGTPVDIAADDNAVNVVDGSSDYSVVTIDVATNHVNEPTPFPGDSFYAPLVASGVGTFWLAEAETHGITSADPGGSFQGIGGGRTIPIPTVKTNLLTQYVSFDDLAAGEGMVWVAGDFYGRTVWRVNPASGQVTAIPLPFIPGGIAAGEGAVWVTSVLDDTLARIDPKSTRIVARIPVGRGAAAVAVGEGAVWVADSLTQTLSKIDPRTNKVTSVPIGVIPIDIAVGAGGVWVVGKRP